MQITKYFICERTATGVMWYFKTFAVFNADNEKAVIREFIERSIKKGKVILRIMRNYDTIVYNALKTNIKLIKYINKEFEKYKRTISKAIKQSANDTNIYTKELYQSMYQNRYGKMCGV